MSLTPRYRKYMCFCNSVMHLCKKSPFTPNFWGLAETFSTEPSAAFSYLHRPATCKQSPLFGNTQYTRQRKENFPGLHLPHECAKALYGCEADKEGLTRSPHRGGMQQRRPGSQPLSSCPPELLALPPFARGLQRRVQKTQKACGWNQWDLLWQKFGIYERHVAILHTARRGGFVFF